MSDPTKEVCRNCRDSIETHCGYPLAELGVNIEIAAALFRCQHCGAYWRLAGRSADVIAAAEAQRLFPEVFAPLHASAPTADTRHALSIAQYV